MTGLNGRHSDRFWWVMSLLLMALSGCNSKSAAPASDAGSSSPASSSSQQDQSSTTKSPAVPPSSTPSRPEISTEVAAEIDRFCTACHLNPRADYFPRHAWHDEVDRAFGFFVESGRSDLKVPPIATVVRYFQSRAPEKLSFPPPTYAEHPASMRWEKQEWEIVTDGAPAIGNIRWTQLLPDSQPILLTSDIRSGEVRAGHPSGKSRLLAKLRHPCRAEPTDLDQDGVTDLLVADLGSFEARDHHDGRVVWLRPAAENQPWEIVELLGGLGRVADVRAADFDGDGDLDLVVAEFGWQKTGSVFWLENQSEKTSRPKFTRHEVDGRAGGIHLPIVDWNGDGKPDFLALMSQGYEEILAWINQGDGTFQRQVISPSQDPAFGSSGIELVDLDTDGDLDLLYSNGDTFDSKIAKPYHGLQWLENRGAAGFRSHRLTDLIGAYRALAVDMDLDGDLDIVAAGFLSGDLVDPPPLDQHDSVILLEQTSSGVFARRRLLQGAFDFPSIEVADFDGDGRPDIAAGNFQRVIQPNKPRAVIWWNRRS